MGCSSKRCLFSLSQISGFVEIQISRFTEDLHIGIGCRFRKHGLGDQNLTQRQGVFDADDPRVLLVDIGAALHTQADGIIIVFHHDGDLGKTQGRGCDGIGIGLFQIHRIIEPLGDHVRRAHTVGAAVGLGRQGQDAAHLSVNAAAGVGRGERAGDLKECIGGGVMLNDSVMPSYLKECCECLCEENAVEILGRFA